MIFVPYDVKEDASSKTLRLSRKKILKKTFKGTIVLLITFLLALFTYLTYPTLIRDTIAPIVVINETIFNGVRHAFEKSDPSPFDAARLRDCSA